MRVQDLIEIYRSRISIQAKSTDGWYQGRVQAEADRYPVVTDTEFPKWLS